MFSFPCFSSLSSRLPFLSLLLFLPVIRTLDNGVGTLPLMGFNSWSAYGPAINETIMQQTIDFFITNGLDKVGYTYINIDDGWAVARDSNGIIQADPVAFPNGIPALAAYAHSKGLKFGLYSSASPKTCNQRPGSFGYEMIDAATYAQWQVDYLKLDNCGDQNIIGPPESNYAVMRDALNATNRTIAFSACFWAVDTPAVWATSVANSWRTTYDLQPYWECVVDHIDWTNIFADFAGYGGYNDMDMLQIGLPGFTEAENIAHMSLWAIMKSPLLISCPVTSSLCQSVVNIFNNTEIIAISQDSLGIQAKRVYSSGMKGVPYGKSGICGQEELPQNTIIQPCDSSNTLQQWDILPNGTIYLPATDECLQLDSGQSGCCTQDWNVWMNNVASGLCNDPASCCNAHQQLWFWGGTSNRNIVSNVSLQCITVQPTSLYQVGVLPCSLELEGLQTWSYRNTTRQFISAVTPDHTNNTEYCLSRTADVQGGAIEVWTGPLSNANLVVLVFNRNMPTSTNITFTWSMIGITDNNVNYRVRDLWLHADMGVHNTSYTGTNIDVHGVGVYRLSPV